MNEEVKKAIDILIYQAKIGLFKQCSPDINSNDILNEVMFMVKEGLLKMFSEELEG